MSKIDLTSKIEQLEAFEERLGVSFKSLSAFMDADDDDYISIDVLGEIHAAKGTKINDDINVTIAIYDSNDRVVVTSQCGFDSEDFFGFDTFSEQLYVPVKNISKIRIYPKKG